jgi:uncharacterized membrane protein HdeD (DUF308 family)
MTSIDMPNPPGSGSTIRDVWRVFLVEGIICLLLGAGALLVPAVASVAVALLLGWLFMIGGLVGLATTVMGRKAPGFGWALVSSLVTIAAGIFLVLWPLSGVVSLTLVLAVYLAVDGVISIFFAVAHRRQLTRRWGWLFLNGVLDLAMAAIIFVVLPGSAYWVLGVLIGIDFLFAGASLIAIAMAARHPGAVEA